MIRAPAHAACTPYIRVPTSMIGLVKSSGPAILADSQDVLRAHVNQRPSLPLDHSAELCAFRALKLER